jgi:integrase
MEVPQTVFDAVTLFLQDGDNRQNSGLINNLRSGLRKYVLPDYGFSGLELKKLDVILTKVPLEKFRNVEELLNKNVLPLIESGTLKSGTLSGYQSAISRFVNWLRPRGWYPELPPAPPKDEGKYCPQLGNSPKQKDFRYLTPDRKGKRCRSEVHYALKESELTPKILRQLEGAASTPAGPLTKQDFDPELLKDIPGLSLTSLPGYNLHYFLTAKEVPKRKDKAIREVTYKSKRGDIVRFLGWLKHFKGWHIDELGLELMANQDLVEEFVAWGINERKNSYTWAALAAGTALSVMKWLYHKQSKATSYRDIEAIRTFRDYANDLGKKRREEEGKVALEKPEKFLTFEECEQLLVYLKQRCAPRRQYFRDDGSRRATASRSLRAILSSWQHYLIIALLVYCPVRQRELRELELGVNLFREADGYWVILDAEGHKTGSITGKGREYPLPEELTEALDEWLETWRPQMQTEHNYVFTMLGSNCHPETAGKPYNSSAFGKYVTHFMYKVTSFLFGEPKRTNPHFFRNIAITHQRMYGTPEQQEAMAEMLGHSVKEANRTYSLMTSRDKTLKARQWWKRRDIAAHPA